jgi:type II secretory pathway pseudopilin PulG
MKVKISPKLSGGTTLVEVLFSAAIMAICAGGLMGAMANGFFTIQMAQENQRATQILLEQTESIRLYNWDEVNTPGFIPTTFTAYYDPQSTNTGSGGAIYSGTVSIAPVPFSTTYSTNMRQVTLTLNWTTKKAARSRTLTTLISKDGLQNYVY